MTKTLISTNQPNPIRETWVSKLVFITIPCLKFWHLYKNKVQLSLFTVYLAEILQNITEPFCKMKKQTFTVYKIYALADITSL